MFHSQTPSCIRSINFIFFRNDAKRSVEKKQKEKTQYSERRKVYENQLKHLQDKIKDDQEVFQQKKIQIERLSDTNDSLKKEAKKLAKETEKKE